MDSDSIKKWQAKKIGESLQPMLNYLYRLWASMEKNGFPGDDPYFLVVCRAYDAMQTLFVQTHYLSCDGVGMPRREEVDEE